MLLESLLEDLETFEDWEEKYAYIIDMGKKLPEFPTDKKTDEYKVDGCMSQVWLNVELDESGNLKFSGDSDALIVKGLIAVLLQLYNGRSHDEILDIDAEAEFRGLGLESHLSPTRRNGFFSMVGRIREYAELFNTVDKKRHDNAGRQADDILYWTEFMQATKAYLSGDYETTFSVLEPLANKGYFRAQNNLAFLYDKGLGVSQNYSEAFKWYSKAAEQGDANSQHRLGMMYEAGDGVIKDFNEAMKWFHQAASQGYAESQYYIGLAYDKGQGVSQDLKEAIKWYRLAAEQGNMDAQASLNDIDEAWQGNTEKFKK